MSFSTLIFMSFSAIYIFILMIFYYIRLANLSLQRCEHLEEYIIITNSLTISDSLEIRTGVDHKEVD